MPTCSDTRFAGLAAVGRCRRARLARRRRPERHAGARPRPSAAPTSAPDPCIADTDRSAPSATGPRPTVTVTGDQLPGASGRPGTPRADRRNDVRAGVRVLRLGATRRGAGDRAHAQRDLGAGPVRHRRTPTRARAAAPRPVTTAPGHRSASCPSRPAASRGSSTPFHMDADRQLAHRTGRQRVRPTQLDGSRGIGWRRARVDCRTGAVRGLHDRGPRDRPAGPTSCSPRSRFVGTGAASRVIAGSAGGHRCRQGHQRGAAPRRGSSNAAVDSNGATTGAGGTVTEP